MDKKRGGDNLPKGLLLNHLPQFSLFTHHANLHDDFVTDTVVVNHYSNHAMRCGLLARLTSVDHQSNLHCVLLSRHTCDSICSSGETIDKSLHHSQDISHFRAVLALAVFGYTIADRLSEKTHPVHGACMAQIYQRSCDTRDRYPTARSMVGTERGLPYASVVDVSFVLFQLLLDREQDITLDTGCEDFLYVSTEIKSLSAEHTDTLKRDIPIRTCRDTEEGNLLVTDLARKREFVEHRTS